MRKLQKFKLEKDIERPRVSNSKLNNFLLYSKETAVYSIMKQ